MAISQIPAAGLVSPITLSNASLTTANVTTLNAPSGPLATQNGMNGIAKAWVNFNGGSSPTINGSFNVSSVTYVSTGTYTINMTTALANANYVPVGSVWNNAFPSAILEINSGVTFTTTQFGVVTKNGTNNTTGNSGYVYVAVLGS